MGKLNPFKKKAVEDLQVKGYVVDEVTQQTGYVKMPFSTHAELT